MPSILVSLAERVRMATGWRAWLIAFAAGAISVLALAPFGLYPVMFVSFSCMVWLLDGAVRPRGTEFGWRRAVRRSAAIGWWFGFGYFLFGLYWIANSFLVEADKFAWLIPFAIAALPAGLALFFAAGLVFAALFWQPASTRALVLAIAFGVTEWLRGHVLTGFPWNLLGYTLTESDWLIGSAAVFGVNGLTLLAVLLFAAPAGLSGTWRVGVPAAILVLLLAVQLPAIQFPGGRAEMPATGTSSAADTPARLRLVQPNIPQRDKWLPEQRRAHFEKLLALSRDGAGSVPGGLEGITHIIWPETAVPFLLLDTTEGLDMIGQMLPQGAILITGAHRLEGQFTSQDRKVFNSVVALDDLARPVAIYDKHHLVPFGEYLPFQHLLESIGLEQLTRMKGGFDSGPGATLLRVAGLPPFVPLICYEIIFSGEVMPGGRDGVDAQRPEFLLNLTNDSWFGDTGGPYQHLQQSRLRAVEQGLPVIRVANTGVSAVIAADGRIVEQRRLGAAGVIDTDLPKPLPRPLYAHFGDWVLVFQLLMCVCFLAYVRFRSVKWVALV